MTRLTKTPSAVTLTGTAELITLPCAYLWVWVRNDGDKTVYISQTSDVGEGAAGTIAVPAGGAARLALTSDGFCARGTGVIQVAAANYTDCPFKDAPASGGGGNTIINDNILSSTDTTLSSQKILDVIDWKRGITLYQFATLTDEAKSITVNLPVGTILYAEIYPKITNSYDTGYNKLCGIWLQIFDAADGKNVSATVPYSSSYSATLRYTPSTQQLLASISNGPGKYVAKIYRAEGVNWGFITSSKAMGG